MGRAAGAGIGDKRLGSKNAALLLIFAFALFLPGFFSLPPFDRDEARFVQASKQMVESGDYLDIRFQDDARHKKPIGIYWLQAGALKLSGQDAAAPLWVYRLVSLSGALLAVLGTGLLGARLFGAGAGLAAGFGLAASLLLGVEARLAKTDAMLLATIVAMQAGLAVVYLKHRAPGALPATWLPALVFWLALGAGTLIKGPVAPAVAGLTILCLSLADRDWRWLLRLKPLAGLPLAAAIVLPWFIAITLQSDGGFLQESFGKDIFGKIFEGQESHGALPGYYLAVFWAISWPFGPAILLAFLFAWRERKQPVQRFLLAWILPTWLVFELIMTKLPHYLLPVFPALFILFGWSFARLKDEALPVARQAALLRIGQGLFVLVGLLLALGAPFAIGEGGGDWIWWGPLLAGVVLVLWGALSPGRLREDPRRLRAALAGAFLVYFASYQGILPSMERIWLAPRIAEAFQDAAPCPDSRLVSSGFREPSLVFLAGTETLLSSAGGAAKLLLEDRRCRLALVDESGEAAFRGALGEAAADLKPLAEIEGFNYSGGDPLRLTLYGIAHGE